jgi:hypothetical protein
MVLPLIAPTWYQHQCSSGTRPRMRACCHYRTTTLVQNLVGFFLPPLRRTPSSKSMPPCKERFSTALRLSSQRWQQFGKSRRTAKPQKPRQVLKSYSLLLSSLNTYLEFCRNQPARRRFTRSALCNADPKEDQECFMQGSSLNFRGMHHLAFFYEFVCQ